MFLFGNYNNIQSKRMAPFASGALRSALALYHQGVSKRHTHSCTARRRNLKASIRKTRGGRRGERRKALEKNTRGPSLATGIAWGRRSVLTARCLLLNACEACLLHTACEALLKSCISGGSWLPRPLISGLGKGASSRFAYCVYVYVYMCGYTYIYIYKYI